MSEITTTRPAIDLQRDLQRDDLHIIRLEAESLRDQLHFIWESLAGASGEGATGRQLYPCAIRGLRDMLESLEDKASGISSRAKRLLGVPEE